MILTDLDTNVPKYGNNEFNALLRNLWKINNYLYGGLSSNMKHCNLIHSVGFVLKLKKELYEEPFNNLCGRLNTT